MADKKKGFIVYCDMLNHIESLNMKQRGLLLTAMLCDQSGLELPQMDGGTRVAFSFIKSGMDRDTEKYNRIVEKRREAGKKGGRPPKGEESKKKQKKANESKPKANESNDEAKKPDNGERITDNGYRITDNGKQITEINREGEGVNPRPAFEVNYQQVADMYNNTCVSFPRLTTLSDARKKAIKARLKVYTLDDFQRLFDKAEESSFLKGANTRNWIASFDWLIKDGNMAKVLDGNYDDRAPRNPAAGSPINQTARELDEFYDMVTDWVASKEEQQNG